MAKIEERLAALGLFLPPPVKAPAGVVLPFQFVRVVGSRALISGHGPHNPDGSFAGPLGKLGRRPLEGDIFAQPVPGDDHGKCGM